MALEFLCMGAGGGGCPSLHDLTLGSNSGLAITGQSGTPAGTPDSLAGFLPPGLKKLLMQVRTYWSVTQPAPRRGPRKRQVQTFLTLKIRAPSWKATPARALGRSLSPESWDAAVSTHESRGVVVLHSLGIPEGLQDGVGLQQLPLQLTLEGTQVL